MPVSGCKRLIPLQRQSHDVVQAYGQHMGSAGLGQDSFGYGGSGVNPGNMMDALQAQFAGLSTGQRRDNASRHPAINAAAPSADA